MLASVDRHSAQRVAHSIGVSRPTVWRWATALRRERGEGLLRDKLCHGPSPPSDDPSIVYPNAFVNPLNEFNH